MSKSKKLWLVLMILAITSIDTFMLSKTAAANECPALQSLELNTAACASGPEQHPELVRLHDDISKAGSLNEARALALVPTADAIDALRDARAFMPFNEDLRLAETRLSDARSRIENAKTQDQVADEFSGMLLAGLDDDRAAGVDVGGIDCNYSTGEIVAIVIGLILGVIPGLILLVVLC